MTLESKTLDPLVGHWWILVLRGLLAILAGIACLILPARLVAASLLLLFAFYVIADGMFNVISAVRSRPQERWWSTLLLGGVEIIIGLLTFVMPKGIAWILMVLIAAWAIILGAFTLFGALQLRREFEGEIWLAVAGILSIIFGLIALIMPLVGLEILRFVLGFYLMVMGVILIGFAFRLRGLR